MSAARGRFDASLERLHRLYPKLIDLKLDRLVRLLGALGDPQLRLPPVIHVAGTNGKGSVCAFARAMAEAAGLRVHVYTSPHLVKFNERIRLAGALVSDEALAGALDEIEAVNEGNQITVFEAITAAAFLLFARVPADLCVVEVGLGGRFDATNVVRPAACAITSISMDHQDFLGDTLGVIAAEKAGIIKPGVPVVVGGQAPEALAAIMDAAQAAAAPLLLRGRDWEVAAAPGGLRFQGMDLPPPALAGVHQAENAAIAMMTLRAAGFDFSPEVLAAGLRAVEWPARLQLLHGALLALLPQGSELWLDGAHNPGGAEALAAQLQSWAGPVTLVLGMKQAKDVGEVMRILLPHAAQIFAVAEPGQHLALPVEAIVEASGGRALVGPDVAGALAQITAPTRVLICGSLYLAGEVLKMDGAAAALARD
ncbi:bifunctional folylpolyglutamate synthase/dihydrofolate synthase [Acidocella aquatica]|uniref:Dihydrofolate synthase/folylpolyglutamate synthase n=1 Tax=Acidocella aquatica TaxID=1922313 RepID=A0ABQ6A8P2_9PROT|nr:folylpolyglutamate synthase/dihydrofolate synthase family protein [Acidocella aquatica]GLR67678.1 bifunctional folylpolyglutamate synthase/dihydrofolate synthase [Acidocella aquatica]